MAAYFLSQNTTLTPDDISNQIISLGQVDVLGGVLNGTVNILAYNGEGGSAAQTNTSSTVDSATSSIVLSTTTAIDTSQPSSNGTDNAVPTSTDGGQ